MSPLLIALLGVVFIPLFVATWRTSLAGLAAQGLLMAWIAHRLSPSLPSPRDWLTLVDLGLVRGVLAPLALGLILRQQKAPARNDVVPPNLLSWTFALGMALVGFSFAEVLVPEPGEQRTLVAVAATGVLVGLLVLATQSGPFSQMIGALRLENAIALLELGGHRHAPAPSSWTALGVQLGQLLIFVMTVVLYRWYLSTLGPTAGDRPPPSSASASPSSPLSSAPSSATPREPTL